MGREGLRRLEEQLYASMKEGKWKELLEYVREDDMLCMELRGTRADVYYRGCLLFSIKEDGLEYNTEYKNDKKEYTFEHNPKLEVLLDSIPYYKQNIDFWFYKKGENGNQKQPYEREFEQLILRENNSNKLGNKTDYWILDMEYNCNEGSIAAKPDLIAIKNTRSSRTPSAMKKPHRLAFIEVKYGDGAYLGSAGVQKHLEDYVEILENQEIRNKIAEDMEQVFRQKKEMGLIPGSHGDIAEITIEKGTFEFVFALLGRNTNETVLISELQKCLERFGEEKLKEVYIAQTSELGVGLYEDRMIPLKEYIAKA